MGSGLTRQLWRATLFLIMNPMNVASRTARTCLALGIAASFAFACGDDSSGGTPGPTNTGQACETADQCYPSVQTADLAGDAVCLDRVEGGYCTHLCSQDSDCCAAAGECPNAYSQVCSPFESAGDLHCFLSCEKTDLDLAKLSDADAFCQKFANAAFHCRSSGGGADNRKVCVP